MFFEYPTKCANNAGGKRLILHEQTVAFHANLIYTATSGATGRAVDKHASRGSPFTHRAPVNSEPTGSTLRLTRFPVPRKLCQDIRCHYGVMKIYNGDSGP